MTDMNIIAAGWTWWTLMYFLGLLIKDITMPDFTGYPTGLNHESQADGQIPLLQLSPVSTCAVQCFPVKKGYQVLWLMLHLPFAISSQGEPCLSRPRTPQTQTAWSFYRVAWFWKRELWILLHPVMRSAPPLPGKVNSSFNITIKQGIEFTSSSLRRQIGLQ